MKLSIPTDYRPAFKEGIRQYIESDIAPTIPQMADIPPSASSIQSGAFGTTYLSKDRQYAVKIIDYNNYQSRIRDKFELNYWLTAIKTDLHNEIINYYDISLKCPEYFCRFVGYNYDHTNFKMHIIMEYCGKDLFSEFEHVWKRAYNMVNEESAITYRNESPQQKTMRLQRMFHGILYQAFAPILHEIALAIRCLHSNNYVHFDIKLENIVVSDNAVKFIDAGSLTKITNTGLTKVYGTMEYIAPELKNGTHLKPSLNNTSALMKTDIYSFGKMIQKMEVNMFHNDYLQKIMSINPDDRPSIDEIIEVIESPAPAPTVRPDSPIEKYLGGKSKRRERSKCRRKQKRSKRRRGIPFA